MGAYVKRGNRCDRVGQLSMNEGGVLANPNYHDLGHMP